MRYKSIRQTSPEQIPYGYCQCGCGNKAPLSTRDHPARGYVKGHPHLFCPGHNTRKSARIIDDRPEKPWVKVELTRGKVALVDREDAPLIADYSWCANQRHVGKIWFTHSGRARNGMHRLLLDPPAPLEVDHINGNPLDNRRQNLRVVTKQQNLWNKHRLPGNKTGYVGVQPKGNRFLAKIHFDGKQHEVGRFDTPEEAARCYDEFAYRLRGEFAVLNFPRRKVAEQYEPKEATDDDE